MKKCEILAPAGDIEKLKFAVMYGADAVYSALKSFGMRASAGNLSREDLKEGLDFAHAHGAKLYCTLNTMPHENELYALDEMLDSISDTVPDAFIISDPGVLSTVKKRLPTAELHLSTQCSTVNSRSCNFWYDAFGVKRIVLARELTLKEIEGIRKNIPDDLELECFVHGAMCISYSGRCLLSNYATGRDANRGMCAQPCRWQYCMNDTKEGFPMGYAEQYPEGTYVFSSKDLCMIEHVPSLVEAGIDSFKIEGRMKSAYYTAAVTNAYRKAYDAYVKNPSEYVFDPLLKKETESVSHREYGTGFYFVSPHENAQVCKENVYINDRAYLATVSEITEDGLAKCIQRNKFYAGDKVQVLSPGSVGKDATVEKLYDEEMNEIESVPHAKQTFYAKIDGVKPWDIIRCGDMNAL